MLNLKYCVLVMDIKQFIDLCSTLMFYPRGFKHSQLLFVGYIRNIDAYYWSQYTEYLQVHYLASMKIKSPTRAKSIFRQLLFIFKASLQRIYDLCVFTQDIFYNGHTATHYRFHNSSRMQFVTQSNSKMTLTQGSSDLMSSINCVYRRE